MKSFRVEGKIVLSDEIDAETEVEAINFFKKIYHYQHDCGLEVTPEVTNIEEVKRSIY